MDWNYIKFDPSSGGKPAACPVCGCDLLDTRCTSNPRVEGKLFERDVECESCLAPLVMHINLETLQISIQKAPGTPDTDEDYLQNA